MEHVAWTKDFLVFLAIAGLAVPLLHRFGVSQVLSFLALGVAVGPFGFGRLGSDYPWLRHVTLDDPQRVAPFAELGVMALLFLIGLELSWSRLAALRRYVLGVGGMQFAVSAVAIGAGAALLGAGPATAAVIGISLAMSSTAVVMQIVEEQGRTATHVGRVALSILLFQDLMVAPVLFTAGFLGSGGSSLADLGWLIAEAVALLVVIAVVGRYVLGAVFRLAAQTGSRELIMAISLLVLIGFSILTARVGLSAALGAFLAGLLLSETEYRHQVEIDLSPFKGLLVGLFFISVGMTVDLAFLLKWLPQIVAAAAALIVVKAAIIIAAGRVFGVGGPVSAEIALLLAQSGEFAFVAFGVAAAEQAARARPRSVPHGDRRADDDRDARACARRTICQRQARAGERARVAAVVRRGRHDRPRHHRRLRTRRPDGRAAAVGGERRVRRARPRCAPRRCTARTGTPGVLRRRQPHRAAASAPVRGTHARSLSRWTNRARRSGWWRRSASSAAMRWCLRVRPTATAHAR